MYFIFSKFKGLSNKQILIKKHLSNSKWERTQQIVLSSVDYIGPRKEL